MLAPAAEIVKLSLPEVAFVPSHAPEAEQDAAKDDDQLIVIESFIEISVSEAEIDTDGLGVAAGAPPPPPPPPPQLASINVEVRMQIKKFFIKYNFF